MISVAVRQWQSKVIQPCMCAQPNTKSNPNPNPNPNPDPYVTARNSEHSPKYNHMSYVSREIHTRQCCCTVCNCHTTDFSDVQTAADSPWTESPSVKFNGSLVQAYQALDRFQNWTSTTLRRLVNFDQATLFSGLASNCCWNIPTFPQLLTEYQIYKSDLLPVISRLFEAFYNTIIIIVQFAQKHKYYIDV